MKKNQKSFSKEEHYQPMYAFNSQFSPFSKMKCQNGSRFQLRANARSNWTEKGLSLIDLKCLEIISLWKVLGKIRRYIPFFGFD